MIVLGRKGLWEVIRVRSGHESGLHDGIRNYTKRKRDLSLLSYHRTPSSCYEPTRMPSPDTGPLILDIRAFRPENKLLLSINYPVFSISL
jgi:hypothetical protein